MQTFEHRPQEVDEPLVLDAGEVGTRAEVAAGAREHQDPRARLVDRVGDGVAERLQRGVVERVATLGAVEGDDDDIGERRAGLRRGRARRTTLPAGCMPPAPSWVWAGAARRQTDVGSRPHGTDARPRGRPGYRWPEGGARDHRRRHRRPRVRAHLDAAVRGRWCRAGPRGVVDRHHPGGAAPARPRPGRRRRHRGGLGHRAVVGHRRRRRVGHRPHERGHVDGLARRQVHPRGHRRHHQGPGLRGPEAAELRAEVGRRAEPLGQGPHRAHPLHPQRAARGLPGHGDVPRAGRLPQPAAHGACRVEPRLHHGPLAHRQPRPRPDRLRRRAHLAVGPRPGPAARAGALGHRHRHAHRRRGRRDRARRRAPRWSPARATSTRRSSARGRWPTTPATSTSAPRRGSPATCPGSAPTC